MGVTCQIWINTQENGVTGVYKPGTPVRGVVKYFIDVPTEYQNMTLSLLGKGKCRWADSNIRTSVGTEMYINHHINIINERPEDTDHLQSGAYEYPFEFNLPEDIPSSYKDDNSWITYWIQLKFVKPSFFSFKTVFASNIRVQGFVDHPKKPGALVNNGPVIFGLKKALFAPFAAKTPMVHLKVEIAKSFLSPGENIHLTCTVSNQTDVTITALKAELYYYTSYKSDYGSNKKVDGAVKGCRVETAGVPGGKVETFTCVIPTLPQVFSIQHSKIISKRYSVCVTVRLPMPYINASVQMPIVLGERRPSEPYREAFASDSQPPTYREAMCEEKMRFLNNTLITPEAVFRESGVWRLSV